MKNRKIYLVCTKNKKYIEYLELQNKDNIFDIQILKSLPQRGFRFNVCYIDADLFCNIKFENLIKEIDAVLVPALETNADRIKIFKLKENNEMQILFEKSICTYLEAFDWNSRYEQEGENND